MANPEHVEVVCKGKDAIDEWRKRNPRSLLDLSESDLNGVKLDGANLRGANLHRTDLQEATLNRANLTKANLSWADLTYTVLDDANLTKADLTEAHLIEAFLKGATLADANMKWVDMFGAHLMGANLARAQIFRGQLEAADLSGADLRETVLAMANLSRAILNKAKFQGAVSSFTIWTAVDLSSAVGLSSMRHEGPSSIGLGTIRRSGGKIPKTFLRGCGLDDTLIDNIPRLFGDIQFHSCFVSYSHKDKAFALRLHDALQARGIRCWLDDHELRAGDDVYREVDRGIRLWDKVLLCASESSLGSRWVQREIRTAIDKENQLHDQGHDVPAIIPLNLDGALVKWEGEHAAELRSRLAPDFTGWESDNATFEREFERVVQALDAKPKQPPPESKIGSGTA